MKQESQMSQQNSQKQRQGTSSSYRLTTSELASQMRAMRDAEMYLLLKGLSKPDEQELRKAELDRYHRLKDLPEEQWGLYDKEGMPLQQEYYLPDNWMDYPEDVRDRAINRYLDGEDWGMDRQQIHDEWRLCWTDHLDPEDPRHLM